MDYLDNVAFVVLRLQESSQPDEAHEAFQAVLAEVERWRENAYKSALRIADALAKMADELREDVESDRAALAKEKRDPRACEVQDLDRAGNYCTVHGWHPTLECFESERLGIARDALAEEPGAHHDAGPGPEHERGPNMKDVG